MRFSPACVHAQEHIGPILRLGTSGTGMNRDDGIFIIVPAAKKGVKLQLAQLLFQGSDFQGKLLFQRFIL